MYFSTGPSDCRLGQLSPLFVEGWSGRCRGLRQRCEPCWSRTKLWCSLETSVQGKDDFGEREAATIKRLDNIWMVQTGEVAWLVLSFLNHPNIVNFLCGGHGHVRFSKICRDGGYGDELSSLLSGMSEHKVILAPCELCHISHPLLFIEYAFGWIFQGF
jgi:hypothetical protein